MHRFFEFCNEMLCVADNRGHFTQVNRAWTKTLGWSTEEMTSRPYIDFVHPDDVEATLKEAQMLHGGTHETSSFENRYRCQDGSYRWLSWQAIFDPDAKEIVATARDVTTLKVQAEALRDAEQAARDSESRLLLALEAGRMGIWSWELATGRVQSSETQALIHGRSADQTETQIDSEGNIHPDDRQIVRTAIERAIANEAADRVTYRVVWPDGSLHWVEAIGRVSCNASGKPVHVTGVCVDITERKLAENSLRQSEERFRLLAMHAPVGIALCDAEGRTVFANPKACELAGARPEEIMGFDWQTFIHPDDRQALLAAWQSDIAAGKIHSSGEFRFARKDGTVRWASSTASLVHDADGTPIGQIGITLDITDRKAAEDQLRTREAQLTGILDNTTAVVYLKDAEGRVQLVNHRYESLFQSLGDEFIGKKDAEIFPEDIARKFMESDAKIWREQKAHVFEEVAPHEDGPHIYRSVKFPVRDKTGRMVALGGISTDITDLTNAYDDLRKKGVLLRNLIDVQENEKRFLCHEFHDGLIQYAVASLMALEAQRLKQPSVASPTLDTVIENLRRGVEDGRRVIRGIRPAVLDDSGLPAAIEDLIGQFENSGIHVTGKCNPEIGRLPEAIQTTVYRVVQEALNNAKKHSGTDVVRIELKKLDGDLHLEVRDFGCGFDVHTSRKDAFGLLGMTERVRLHGGELSIDSEHDVGTTISVRLPIPSSTTTEVLEK